MEETIEIRLCAEAMPFLVKGVSAKTGAPVIGFPYVYMYDGEEGELKFCNCILAPTITKKDEPKLEIAGYDIAFTPEEFHPVKGPMHKFLRMSEDGFAIFEGDE